MSNADLEKWQFGEKRKIISVSPVPLNMDFVEDQPNTFNGNISNYGVMVIYSEDEKND
jgi:hypothetical protein